MGLYETFLDVIWPRRCAGCGDVLGAARVEVDSLFCATCALSVERLEEPCCPVCGVPFSCAGASHVCLDCVRDPPGFAALRAVYLYGGAAAEAVLGFKYRARVDLARGFGEALARVAAELGPVDRVVPVPLTPRRLRRRGYNQAGLIARVAGRRLGVRFTPEAVARVQEGTPQAGLDRAARLANIRGAFRVTRPDRVRGRRVLLVDDVVTTTATTRELARVLVRAGAAEVVVAALARAD
jgi:ComF family protein